MIVTKVSSESPLGEVTLNEVWLGVSSVTRTFQSDCFAGSDEIDTTLISAASSIL
ncbi:unannotated protein [freshwater metagenome]|uniref:Unannotated protein n=1 Tax=freshwater metagenome TaxID=449393 RepID=A0A6J6NDV7_9ZZZZ